MPVWVVAQPQGVGEPRRREVPGAVSAPSGASGRFSSSLVLMKVQTAPSQLFASNGNYLDWRGSASEPRPGLDGAGLRCHDRPMLRASVLLASVALVMALPAAASNAATAKSLTIRVFVKRVTQSIKDVPPRTFRLAHEYTKGDTIRGMDGLRNAVRQFNKPNGASVGTDRYVFTAVAWQKVSVDFVARFPGGTVHAHGEGKIGSKPELPIVGGTGLYAGASGVVEGRHLANGKKLNIYRLQLP